jgi:hypothetical protein
MCSLEFIGLGRSRAWFRVALNMKILDGCLLGFARQKSFVAKFYDSYSFLADNEGVLWISILTALSGVEFELDLNDPSLDIRRSSRTLSHSSSKVEAPKLSYASLSAEMGNTICIKLFMLLTNAFYVYI